MVHRVLRAYGPTVRDWRVAKYMLTFAAVVVVGNYTLHIYIYNIRYPVNGIIRCVYYIVI